MKFFLALIAMTAMAQTEIKQTLIDRIDKHHMSTGIVVGIIDANGRRVISHGPVDADTVFEIGSVTKVFTSLLLADMVKRGEVKIDDPVAKYLPAGAKIPERGGRSITLLDLATQSSGLPRMPNNFHPKDPQNPYADYTTEQLYAFLAGYQLTRDIGSQYEYSNLGVGLLGQALAHRAGMDYESLVRARITGPLGMDSTGVTLTPSMKQHLAIGHNQALAPVPNWDLPTLAGAGALRSTANDMLTFLAANLGYEESRLSAAMASMTATRRPAGAPGLEIGLNWHIFTGDNEIVWHNGGTGGYRTFIGYAPKSRVGVVVLSNTFTDAGVDDIGLHILDPKRPLLTLRDAIHVDPKQLETYTGSYQLAPGFFISVTREGDSLYTQATGQPRFEIFASADREFFVKAFDAQLTFDEPKEGKSPGLTLHQGGRNTHAGRVDPSALPPGRKSITLEPAQLDRYLGNYELAPNFVIAVTREGSQLFIQATGQPKLEAFAEAPDKFFLKVVDAQVTFQSDATGRVTALILHQGGADNPGKRIP